MECDNGVLTFKSYELVTVKSPRELGEAGIVVDPNSIISVWGEEAPEIYLKSLGEHEAGHPYTTSNPKA